MSKAGAHTSFIVLSHEGGGGDCQRCYTVISNLQWFGLNFVHLRQRTWFLRSGKTTLLFQYALHVAGMGKNVWFLSDKSSLEQHPPFLPPTADQQNEVLSRIQIKYVNDLQQLKNFGACLHLVQHPPAAIIISNLAVLLKQTRLSDKRAQDVAITCALALVADAQEHFREKHNQDVLLLVSDSTGREGVLNCMYLLQRWFPIMLSVTPGASPSHPQYSLQVCRQSKQQPPAAVARAGVRYFLTQNYVNVESLHDGQGALEGGWSV